MVHVMIISDIKFRPVVSFAGKNTIDPSARQNIFNKQPKRKNKQIENRDLNHE
jgi:hypothetical protein